MTRFYQIPLMNIFLTILSLLIGCTTSIFLTLSASSSTSFYESTTRKGPEAFRAGQDLFRDGQYENAAIELWKSVLWHSETPKSQTYNVQEAFTQFLQCYAFQDKLVDGLSFVALESFRRGQDDMGHNYLNQALGLDSKHEQALLVQQEYGTGKQTKKKVMKNQLYGAKKSTELSAPDDTRENYINQFNPDLVGLSPESLYERASQHFSEKNYEECADLFEISCIRSQNQLGPSCANAVYCRSMIMDWGWNGSGFESDMKRIQALTKQEVLDRRWPISVSKNTSEAEQRSFSWQRATSVHPHMMLGYPIPSIWKRYVAESVAFMDEKMARISRRSQDNHTNSLLPPLPDDMPFSLTDYHDTFGQDFESNSNAAIRIGFVGSGFNSKAVLYLSHDMFRFFNYSRFEVHIFSFGPPDNPLFIEHGMRGIDWRKRVQHNVCNGCFHDLQQMQFNHIEAARYIHNQKIHILIEWDGYARQGERAQGLFALRPSPLQILHQEYLGTSGALYVDYVVSDVIASPPHLHYLYTEKIIYLPNHFFSKGHAFQNEVAKPRYNYLPSTTPYELGTGSPQENKCMSRSPANVSFVFCNFNKFLKNNPETLRSWLRILREVPDSHLCLLENPKEGVQYFRRFVHEHAATMSSENNKILPGDGEDLNSRIHFLPWLRNPFDHQLRNKDFCNIMLDSFPYNGHTVAQDALFAGVPIVTRSDGDDMCSRVTTSANVVLGLARQLNAKNASDYENLSIQLAINSSLFNQVRRLLIDTCLKRNPLHPYWDVARYVKNFETGLEMVWQRFLNGHRPDHVYVQESVLAAKGTYDEEIHAHPPEGLDRKDFYGKSTHKRKQQYDEL